MRNLISSYTRFACVVYSGEVKSKVVTRSRMRCLGWVVGSGTYYSRLIYGNIFDYMYIYLLAYKLYTLCNFM